MASGFTNHHGVPATATSWTPPTFTEYKLIMGTLTMVPMSFREFEYLRLLDERGPLLNSRDWADAVDLHIRALTKPAPDKPILVKHSFQLVLMWACDNVLSHREIFGIPTTTREPSSSDSNSNALNEDDSIESMTSFVKWMKSQIGS
jgi:hypothetical protein